MLCVEIVACTTTVKSALDIVNESIVDVCIKLASVTRRVERQTNAEQAAFINAPRSSRINCRPLRRRFCHCDAVALEQRRDATKHFKLMTRITCTVDLSARVVRFSRLRSPALQF